MKNIILSIFVILFTISCLIAINAFRIKELPLMDEGHSDIVLTEENKAGSNDLNDALQSGDMEAAGTRGNDKKISEDNGEAPEDKNESFVPEGDYKSDDNSLKATDKRQEKGRNYVRYTYNNMESKTSADYERSASEAQSLLSFNEKLYLIGVARYLNGSDFHLIKKYVAEGATQEELDGLWEQMKEKLPESDYDKVYTIFLKYKR